MRLGTRFVWWYLVADRTGVTVVDAAVPGYRPQLEPGLQLLDAELHDVRAVVLTHGDPDHIGASAGIATDTGAPIYIHSAEIPRVRDGVPKHREASFATLAGSPSWTPYAEEFARNGVAETPTISDPVAVRPGELLDVPGRPRVIPTPGHCDGHVVYHFARHRVLCVGDAISTVDILTGEQRVRVPPPAVNVSTRQALASLDAILDIDVDLVLPGHGEVWTGGTRSAVQAARAGCPA